MILARIKTHSEYYEPRFSSDKDQFCLQEEFQSLLQDFDVTFVRNSILTTSKMY